MSRIGRSLALHTAVTGEVTVTTSLGWDTGLVRTIGIDAGLGRPVAGVARKVFFVAKNVTHPPFHGDIVQACNAKLIDFTNAAGCITSRSTLFIDLSCKLDIIPSAWGFAKDVNYSPSGRIHNINSQRGVSGAILTKRITVTEAACCQCVDLGRIGQTLKAFNATAPLGRTTPVRQSANAESRVLFDVFHEEGGCSMRKTESPIVSFFCFTQLLLHGTTIRTIIAPPHWLRTPRSIWALLK